MYNKISWNHICKSFFLFAIRCMSVLRKIVSLLDSSTSFIRISAQLFFDIFILILSGLLGFYLFDIRLFPIKSYLIFYFIVILLGIVIYLISGQYKSLTRYIGNYFFYGLIIRNSFLLLAVYFFTRSIINPSPLGFWLFLWLFINFISGLFRIFARDILFYFHTKKQLKKDRAVIYGAGKSGAQLLTSIRVEQKYQIIAFLDDNPDLWGRKIEGIKINPPQIIGKLATEIDKVFLAIPSITRQRKKEILKNLSTKNLSFLQIPTIDDITTGRAKINTLREITIEDLLGREIAPSNFDLLNSSIQDKVICVSGAGGSIGSEICRQIIKLSPKKLILIDNSEINLYEINRELSFIFPNVYPILGNACNFDFLTRIFNEYSVDLVLHAAAYKHVPLVEQNPIEGVSNNVISSFAICNAVKNSLVSKVILISSDKAVRPTNLMGASKRISELIFQAFANENNQLFENKLSKKKIFSMVRFGNVLGSSGSVIPLFKDQISKGGPITITHPSVTRYFMTIPEAAELVLQSATISKGGEIFLLDMGKPVLILDLAKQMIILSGLTICDESNKKGDIEITYTGLRKGEKLYEELLISGSSKPTIHPLIYSAEEDFFPVSILLPVLEELKNSINKHNIDEMVRIISKLVPEWINKTGH